MIRAQAARGSVVADSIGAEPFPTRVRDGHARSEKCCLRRSELLTAALGPGGAGGRGGSAFRISPRRTSAGSTSYIPSPWRPEAIPTRSPSQLIDELEANDPSSIHCEHRRTADARADHSPTRGHRSHVRRETTCMTKRFDICKAIPVPDRGCSPGPRRSPIGCNTEQRQPLPVEVVGQPATARGTTLRPRR
jgi:hypothetical protein